MSSGHLIKPIIKRRIPQILGVYIAGVWLCVEIADWVSEQFHIAPDLPAYVFVLLIALIPAVAILAWGHGQPGKDQWTRGQIILVSINFFIAIIASLYLGTTATPATALIKNANPISTNISQQTDRNSYLDLKTTQSNLNQRVSVFFWQNNTQDTELDWLSYGAAWLLAQDLKRTPYVSVQTPFDSDQMRLAIQDRGFKDAIGEPLSLDLQVAENRSAKWLVRGSVLNDKEKITFQAMLYDVITGSLVKTISYQSNNWLTALDLISSELSATILASHATDSNQVPELSIEDHVSSSIQAIKYVIESLKIRAFENNYPQAIALLEKSLQLDPSLAEAYMLQMRSYIDMGQFEQAQSMAEKALTYDFKLYDEDIFKVTANLYGVTGEEDKALRVLESWVQEYPESADALMMLGSNLVIKGHRLDDVKQVFEQLKNIEPNSRHLLRLSQIYILKNNLVESEQVIRDFLVFYPNDKNALLALGDVLQRQGRFQTAAEVFEQAVLTAHNDINVGIQYALNKGLYQSPDEAIERLNQLMKIAKNSQQKYQVSLALEQMYAQKGQMQEALNTIETAKGYSKNSQSYIGHILNYHSSRIVYLASLGRFKLAQQELLTLEDSTQAPFNQMLVFLQLTFYDLLSDKDGIEQNLERAKQAIEDFKASIYQQFIYNYEAILLRLKYQYDDAIHWHDKAIGESMQSFLAINDPKVIENFKYEKATTLYMAEDYTEATEIVNQILTTRPRYAEVWLLKIKLLKAQGKISEAKQAANHLTDLWQDADSDYTEYQQFLKLRQSLAL